MFEKLEKRSNKVVLRGIHARAEIMHPATRVWRYRVHPQGYIEGEDLPEKHSFAVLDPRELPFDLDDQGEKWVCSAGDSSLHITFDGKVNLRLDGAPVARIDGVSGTLEPAEPINICTSILTLYAPPGESYMGFGEKTGPLDKRGLKFKFWNTDIAPHQPDSDPLYQSIPFFMALHAGKVWGFFLDESSRSEVDIAQSHPEKISWKVEGEGLDMYFILGDTPAEILRRYTEITGRIPIRPLWAMGLHQSRYSYESDEQVKKVISLYRKNGIPLDVVHLDIHHMEGYKVFTFHPQRFPEPLKLSRWAAEQGVKIITIMDPGLKKEPGYGPYEEAAKKKFLVQTNRGDVLQGEVWPDPAVFPDFIRPEVREWWGAQHQTMLDQEIAGFWNDMNEPSCTTVHSPHDPRKVQGKTLPDDAQHGKHYHLEVHNVYGLCMCRATFEGLLKLQPDRRPYIITRAGYAGIQRYATVWTGDNSSYWEHMELNLRMLLGLGLSGVTCVGSDIGGFLGYSSGELVTRWTWLGVFFPFMRNHSAIGTNYQEPWAFPEYLPFIKAAIELRYRLLPYIYTLMKEGTENGMPQMRAMLLHYPEHGAHFDDQFLLGENLLATPILRPFQTHRSAYFPTAGWSEFDAQTGRLYGSGYELVAAGLDRIPMFIRPGGIVPLTEVTQSLGTAYWDSIEWQVNVQAEGEYRLFEDAGDGFEPGEWTTVRIHHQNGKIKLTREGRSRKAESLMVYGHAGREPYRVELKKNWKQITLDSTDNQ
ncbi:glycoside hydrolase family 31 protein [Deinococcus roseus]|uniref:Alpha-glucosidase n=1 Tax=Deinococcus roseus TaxID=392414 RepID=A0ABQ2D5X2_9DEIO|nr:TIM-barrel domain-containing protein [Deinococcus roseus]GGJ47083.1 alpha-glucosidase [Deinococcus roseus]